MLLEVRREFSFAAAHFLPNYPGKCSLLHGHTWTLEIGATGEVDRKTGMVMDFSRLKEIVNECVIDRVDHTLLNRKEPPRVRSMFPWDRPTAEMIVDWIVRMLRDPLPGLSFVRLYESPTSSVIWERGKHE